MKSVFNVTGASHAENSPNLLTYLRQFLGLGQASNRHAKSADHELCHVPCARSRSRRPSIT